MFFPRMERCFEMLAVSPVAMTPGQSTLPQQHLLYFLPLPQGQGWFRFSRGRRLISGPLIVTAYRCDRLLTTVCHFAFVLCNSLQVLDQGL